MEKMGAADAQIEDLFVSKKPIKNPLVPIGALMTAGVLTAGLVSFRQGNSQLGQKLMRARVVFQGATVALMVGSAYYYGETFRVLNSSDISICSSDSLAGRVAADQSHKWVFEELQDHEINALLRWSNLVDDSAYYFYYIRVV
ncbi:unnamed protein product [Musa hybrid cultivar]